jgi:hypothetical protein
MNTKYECIKCEVGFTESVTQLLCNSCLEKQEQKERKELLESYNEIMMGKEDEEDEKGIRRYVKQIRGIQSTKPKYNSFEEYYEDVMFHRLDTKKVLEKWAPLKPDDMTDEEWEIKERRRWKEDIERMKQNKVDNKLRRTVAPRSILEDNLREIGCWCTAEGLRQNRFCDTCILLAKVNAYLMRLFEDTAEAMKEK